MMDEMTIRVALRTTARISFVLFLGAFLGNALYRLLPAAFTRKQSWVYLGLCGITHGASCVHPYPTGCNRTRARFERLDHGRRVPGRVPVHLCSGCWRSVSPSHILVITF